MKKLSYPIFTILFLLAFFLSTHAQEKIRGWGWGIGEIIDDEITLLDSASLSIGFTTGDIHSVFAVKDFAGTNPLKYDDWDALSKDTLGSFIINGSKGDLELNLPNVYIQNLIILNLKEINIKRITGKYKNIFFKNCRDVKVSPDGNYFFDKLIVENKVLFENCNFIEEFTFFIEGPVLKTEFNDCAFKVRKFSIGIPEKCHLLFDQVFFEKVEKISQPWKNLSTRLMNDEFLFKSLREVDSFGIKNSYGYDYCASAEVNKFNWYEKYQITLHQFQELYKNNYQFEKGDSVFRSIKDLELQKFKYDYTFNRSGNKVKAGVYYYFSAFMGWFCGYGTDPMLALYNSFFLILLFALFYIVFPTTLHEKVPLAEDGFFFLALKSFAREETEVDKIIRSYKEFLAENPTKNFWKFFLSRSNHLLVHYKNSLPPGLPTFFYSFFRNGKKKNLMAFAFTKIFLIGMASKIFFISFIDENFRKRVNDLNEQKRNVTFFSLLSPRIIGIGVIGFLYILITRIPVSLLISINAFSTLGFGQLPLRGVTRYLAILEGLLGWFVLTLFSITFVNILLR